MSENQDVLKVTIQFNDTKIPVNVKGKSALQIYQRILQIFMTPNESAEIEGIVGKSEITDYA